MQKQDLGCDWLLTDFDFLSWFYQLLQIIPMLTGFAARVFGQQIWKKSGLGSLGDPVLYLKPVKLPNKKVELEGDTKINNEG